MADEANNPAPGSPPDQATQELGSPQQTDASTTTDVELDEHGNPVQADDTEEVEHEGHKYRVPKAVKPLLMLQSDYTRKTQELAAKAQAFDSERETFTKSTAAERQMIAEGREIVALDWQIEQLKAVDLAALQQSNPDQAQQIFWRLQQLQGVRDGKARELQQKIGEKQSAAERERANRRDQAQAIIARDVEGWTPELANKVATHAITSLGFTANELKEVEDPRIVKLLHSAYVGQQAIQKLKAAGTQATPQPTPTRTVSGGGQATPAGLSDRASTDVWMKARQAQLRKR